MAARVWAWCGGWHPERFVLYAQLYDVPDVYELIDLLQVIQRGNQSTN